MYKISYSSCGSFAFWNGGFVRRDHIPGLGFLCEEHIMWKVTPTGRNAGVWLAAFCCHSKFRLSDWRNRLTYVLIVPLILKTVINKLGHKFNTYHWFYVDVYIKKQVCEYNLTYGVFNGFVQHVKQVWYILQLRKIYEESDLFIKEQ